jgi:hypothetical protein
MLGPRIVAAQQTAAIAGVRPLDAVLAAAVDEGLASSATFQRIVSAIASTDGIVFLSVGRCPAGLRACLGHKVTRAGGNRLLFVTVNTSRIDQRLIPTLAHELQHAVEVLSEPSNTCAEAVRAYFARIGYLARAPHVFETDAARDVGDAVAEELKAGRAAESTRASVRR